MQQLSVVYRGKLYRRNPKAKQRAHRVYFWCHDKYKESPHSLHRDMWIDAFGPIPPGMHVHHKDSNPFHNTISNFELKSASQHMADHMRSPLRKRQQRCIMLRAVIPAARAWHKSEAGIEWHSKQARKQWKQPSTFTRICEECKQEFQAFHRNSRRCSRRCQAQYFRRAHPGYYQRCKESAAA
jgi:hypothetical protein